MSSPTTDTPSVPSVVPATEERSKPSFTDSGTAMAPVTIYGSR